MIIDQISPCVRKVDVHASRGLTPAYIDAEYVFTYVLAGSGMFILEGVQYYVRPGDMVLMPPYLRHIINTDCGEPMDQFVIHFDLFSDERRKGRLVPVPGMDFQRFSADASNPETLLATAPCIASPQAKERRAVEGVLKRLELEFKSDAPCSELMAKACMLETLGLFLRIAAKRGGEGRRTVRKVWADLERAITFIHAEHARQLSLEEMAAEAGLSPNYFCRMFKEYTGSAPHHYLNGVRIAEAKRLIDEGGLNLSQIAGMTGFPSIHLFSRIFKRHEGAPPSGRGKGGLL